MRRRHGLELDRLENDDELRKPLDARRTAAIEVGVSPATLEAERG